MDTATNNTSINIPYMHEAPEPRSQWPCGLRRRPSAARLLRLWVQIPPGAWMSVCCECCVLSGRGLCEELITRPEESHRLWCVVVCDLETSWKRRPWTTGGCCTKNKQIKPARSKYSRLQVHIHYILYVTQHTVYHNEHYEACGAPSSEGSNLFTFSCSQNCGILHKCSYIIRVHAADKYHHIMFCLERAYIPCANAHVFNKSSRWKGPNGYKI